MPSETLSRHKWHYTFSIPIEIEVPAASRFQNFLKHPRCNAEEAAKLYVTGETREQIAQKMGIHKVTVAKVLHAAQVKMRRGPQVSYLNHPRCPVKTVLKMRRDGKTFEQISQILGVSKPLVIKVYHTIESSSPLLIDGLPVRARVARRVVTDTPQTQTRGSEIEI